MGALSCYPIYQGIALWVILLYSILFSAMFSVTPTMLMYLIVRSVSSFPWFLELVTTMSCKGVVSEFYACGRTISNDISWFSLLLGPPTVILLCTHSYFCPSRLYTSVIAYMFHPHVIFSSILRSKSKCVTLQKCPFHWIEGWKILYDVSIHIDSPFCWSPVVHFTALIHSMVTWEIASPLTG